MKCLVGSEMCIRDRGHAGDATPVVGEKDGRAPNSALVDSFVL